MFEIDPAEAWDIDEELDFAITDFLMQRKGNDNLKEGRTVGLKKRAIVTGLVTMAMLLLFASYANLRWTNEAPAFEKAKETADTPAYVRISGEAFFRKSSGPMRAHPCFPCS